MTMPASWTTGRRWLTWGALACLILLGAYFRLARLGVPALNMDSQDFLTPCEHGISFLQVFTHWDELPTGKNHLPFPVAFTCWVVQTFRLPLTFTTLALPAVLWGLLAIPVAFGIGRELRGRTVGLVLAAVLTGAVNQRAFGWTIHFQIAPGLLLQALGLAVLAALVAGAYPAWRMGRTPPALALREE